MLEYLENSTGSTYVDDHAVLGLTVSTGLNTFTHEDGDFDAADMPVEAGEYIGWYQASSGLMDKITTGGPGYKYDNGDQISAVPNGSGFSTSGNTSHEFQIRVYIEPSVPPYSSSSSSSSSSESSSSSSSSSSLSSSTPESTVTWGHHTDVTEDSDRNFTDNWTTIDNATIEGSGDAEILKLNCTTSSSESETWHLGSMEAKITYDKYGTGSGDAPTIQYKTGTTRVNCEADTWNVYNGTSFTCTGWAKIKVIKA
jgi:hypothetical protein